MLILTLFPELFAAPLQTSILKRAHDAGHVSWETRNIREYATDRHRTVDDSPYGGGAGMVMKAPPLAAAIRHARQDCEARGADGEVILFAPDGETFTQRTAEQLAQKSWLIMVCGHYEGLDERVRSTLIDRELSIGDYVLTGGELPALVVTDAVTRLLPGVLDSESTLEESHSDGLLEYPHYTRPAVWEGQEIPPVLVSGHHGEVARWRREQRLLRTLQRRPDMLQAAATQGLLSPSDLRFLATLGWQLGGGG